MATITETGEEHQMMNTYDTNHFMGEENGDSTKNDNYDGELFGKNKLDMITEGRESAFYKKA